MPLWMQGAVEMLITAFISFGAVFVLLLAVWLNNGFDSVDIAALSRLSVHLWLLIQNKDGKTGWAKINYQRDTPDLEGLHPLAE